MEPTDFIFLVLPLGGLVFVLVSVVLYKTRSEERAKKKLINYINSYTRERREKKKILNEQMERLQAQLKDKSIDKNTYKRFKKIIEMQHSPQIKKTRSQHHTKV